MTPPRPCGEMSPGMPSTTRPRAPPCADVYERCGYLLDAHTAVGYLGLKAELEARGGTGIVLATAHPAKFVDVVRDAVGIEPSAPPALTRSAALPERIVTISDEYRALRDLLDGMRQ